MNAPIPRERLERFAALLAEKKKRDERKKQSSQGGLIEFVRYFWDVLEPQTPLIDGWALEAICEHLEAVTRGEINRLLINVPPGFMKSLLTDVFWPAWEWGPMNLPHMRYVSFSYAASLTLRDNGRFRDLILSAKYQELWGHRFTARKIGEEKVTNDKTGWKLASSVGGVATGERGNRVILDDPHSVKESESEAVRGETVRWFKEAMSNRLNDMQRDAIVIIMQRVHEGDVSGSALEGDEYCHLMIPMEFETARRCETEIDWADPREEEGELAWPERFPIETVESLKRQLGPYAYTGQYQQFPEPRGGGIIKRDWWQTWPDERYPSCEYVLASLDTAYTEKQQNDASALTIWGLFRDGNGNPKMMLMYAWEGRLTLHDLVVAVHTMCSTNDKPDAEMEEAESILKIPSVPRFPVDRLIIETKASGISVIQELERLYSGRGDFAVEGVDPSKWGDKTARMYAIQHLFSDGMIYAPDRKFADMVINNVSVFPKGAHDDLADSVSLALRYLRLSGLLQRKEEHSRSVSERMMFRPKERSLYW